MKVRSIIRVVGGVAVLVLVVVLVTEVREDPTAHLSDADRARATADYQRSKPRTAPDESGARSPGADPKRAVRPKKAPTAPDEHAVDPVPEPPALVEEEPQNDEAEDDERLAEASRLYASGDYAAATKLASEFLEHRPRNNQMLWIMVSSSCATKDRDAAQEWYERLPLRSRRMAREHCAEYGVELERPNPDQP